MIEIKNLKKKYGGTVALDGIDLNIGQGEIIGLFGENGAGKTTLIKSILNLIPFSGEILLDGKPVSRNNITRLSFATVEHSFFPKVDASTHMEFYRDQFDRFNIKRFNGLMEFFSLPYNKPIGSLSTGQQNQFEVILALSQGADYILMDEPFSGSDMLNREDFYKVMTGILEDNETVLLSTHLIEEVSDVINRAVLIRKGRIIGDVMCDDLEEAGKTVVDYVKENYGYQPDRVSKALESITGQDEDNA
ncbi:MAG: ABC transporter ATP-binding protein [Erysipelotrichaceae bacterium]|nr:ABC transporter ATP-binding protein [Erysipelotrichaceae bacterium]